MSLERTLAPVRTRRSPGPSSCAGAACTITALALGVAPAASAQTAYVDTQGREWRQVDASPNLTWLAVDAVCPNDGATPCAGRLAGADVTGWVWATQAQVTELLAEFVPAITEQGAVGGPAYTLAGLFFFGSFSPTFEFYTTFGGYNYVSGWMADERDGMAGVAEVSVTWNAFDSAWNVLGQADVTTATPFRGVWLVKIPVVPCPADLDGSGAVDGADLGVMLTQWGTPRPGSDSADLDGNGIVDGADLGALLSAWGDC